MPHILVLEGSKSLLGLKHNVQHTHDNRQMHLILCITLIKEQLWLTCHSWGLTAACDFDASATCMLAEC